MNHNQLACTDHSIQKVITHVIAVKFLEKLYGNRFVHKLCVSMLKCIEQNHAFRDI